MSERVESNTVVQSYYGNWRLIGMHATEDRSDKATIIYEDSTSPTITPNSTRRFEITKIKDVINNAFVQTPYLQIDGTDNNLSLSQLFDSTRNSNATTLSTYGINKSAAKAIAVTVPSQYDVAKVFRNELPNALNNALCRKAGFTDNCTQQATLKTACENNMAIECRPAVLVTSETKKRHAQLRANSTVLDFNDTSEYTSRTLNSAIYKMVGGQWQAFDENDTTNEINFIKQNTPAGSTPNWLTTEKWNTFFEGMLIQSMFNFDNPEAKNYETNGIATLNSDINATTFASGNSTSWGQYIGVQAEVFQTLLQSIFNSTTSASNTDLASLNIKKIVNEFFGTLLEDPTISQTGKGPYLLGLNVAKTIGKLIGTKLFNYFKLSNVVKMGTAAKYGSLAGMAVGGGLMMLADSQFIKNNDIKITLKVIGGITNISVAAYRVYQTYTGIKTLAEGFHAVSSAGNIAQTVATAGLKTASFASKLSARLVANLKIAGAVLVVAIIVTTWVFGIIAATKAEYGYQKANIISNLIGSTVTMILLAVFASTGIGTLITLIIALIDTIFTSVCKLLSEKQQRGTGGQWLCGGITGLLNKFNTPYAASIVIDPKDPYSRYQAVSSSGSSGLTRPNAGFSAGNAMNNGIKVTDYIQKMPFPAQWQSVFFAWQWVKLDERETSVTK